MPKLTIKTEPYLREFILGKYKENTSGYSFIMLILKPLVEYIPADKAPIIAHGEEYLELELPQYEFGAFNVRFDTVYLSPENAKEFNRLAIAWFRDIYYSYMDDKVRYANKFYPGYGRKAFIKNTIIQFCSDNNMNFNKDNYENLKKGYYRMRKKREKDEKKQKSLGGLVSLKCPPVVPLIFML